MHSGARAIVLPGVSPPPLNLKSIHHLKLNCYIQNCILTGETECVGLTTYFTSRTRNYEELTNADLTKEHLFKRCPSSEFGYRTVWVQNSGSGLSCFEFFKEILNIEWYFQKMNFSIKSSVLWHVGLVQMLAVGNSATANLDVHMPFWNSVFNSWGYLPRNGVAESYGRSVLSFWGKCPHCFSKRLSPLTFPPNSGWGSLPPRSP